MEIKVKVPDEVAAQAQARGVKVEAFVEEILASLSGKDFLDVSLDLDTPRLRLGSDFVGNLDLDFHSKTLARRTRKRRPFGEAKSSAACSLEPQRPNCRLRECRGMRKNCALHNPKEDFGL